MAVRSNGRRKDDASSPGNGHPLRPFQRRKMEITMAENTEHSDDKIKQEATESVRRGEGVRERVRDLTLGALTSRRFNRDEIREVVRAITEGASRGAEGG